MTLGICHSSADERDKWPGKTHPPYHSTHQQRGTGSTHLTTNWISKCEEHRKSCWITHRHGNINNNLYTLAIWLPSQISEWLLSHSQSSQTRIHAFHTCLLSMLTLMRARAHTHTRTFLSQFFWQIATSPPEDESKQSLYTSLHAQSSSSTTTDQEF